MDSSRKEESTKGEVMCERCKKTLGTGDCPRCAGYALAKKQGINLAA